jgi:hypothetical protein
MYLILPSTKRLATHTKNSNGAFFTIRDLAGKEIQGDNPNIKSSKTGYSPVVVPTPPPTVLQNIDRLTFRTRLFELFGITFDQVRGTITASFTDPVEQQKALIIFEEAPSVNRQDPLVLSLATVLNKTPAEVDTLFYSL